MGGYVAQAFAAPGQRMIEIDGSFARRKMVVRLSADRRRPPWTHPVRVMSCCEAGYDGFWLHRFLCDRGIDNQVLDATSILVDRRSRRANTNRLDVAALLRTLMALEHGEPRVCRVVRVPSLEQENERRRSRSGLGWSTNAASIRAGSKAC